MRPKCHVFIPSTKHTYTYARLPIVEPLQHHSRHRHLKDKTGNSPRGCCSIQPFHTSNMFEESCNHIFNNNESTFIFDFSFYLNICLSRYLYISYIQRQCYSTVKMVVTKTEKIVTEIILQSAMVFVNVEYVRVDIFGCFFLQDTTIS